TANTNGSSVLLEWNTATEINNYGFQVQRSEYDKNNPEKREWKILGMVAGAGNSSSSKSYTFVDSGVKYGRYYAYRLKQFDYDGMYFNSQETKAYIGVSVKLELSQNYPNPFNPVTKIRFSVPEETSAKFSIYNIIGQLIYSKSYDKLQSGIHEEEWNGTGFPSGIYIYSLETINSRGIYNKAINKMNLVK
ncbi:MAG TPA: T9SS type A sorting domain-containing protein, partial [Ignavibacteriales bacterium]|nr:T9SS type A sorting domain-containing protein [Ignavibacteriales bacterium]